MAPAKKENILFVLFIFILNLVLRLPSLKYTFLDVDESQFAGFAHVLMDGGLPYRDSLDTKPLLIYYFFAGLFSLFGRTNMMAVHAVSILISFLVALILWDIGRKNYSEITGRWTALLWVVFSTCYFPKFIAASITSVMILPLCLSLWIITKGEHKFRSYLWAGLFIGIAFLFKYQGGIQLVIIGLFLLTQFLKKEINLKFFFSRLFFLSGGFIIPVLLFLLFVYKRGVWEDFKTWSLEGSSHYINAGSAIVPFWENLFIKGGTFVVATAFLWGLLIYFIKTHKNKINENHFLRFTFIWFCLSLIPVCLGGRFYGHYFIQILPPLCLLAAIELPEIYSRHKRFVLASMLVPALLFFVLRADYQKFDQYFPDDQLFIQKKVGLWIKQNTQASDTLFVWGFATAIYFHAERKPVSRFLWTDLLTGKVPGSDINTRDATRDASLARPEAWEAFWQDMKQHPPTYFVDTSTCQIHGYEKYSIDHYSELTSWLSKNYIKKDDVFECGFYKRMGLL